MVTKWQSEVVVRSKLDYSGGNPMVLMSSSPDGSSSRMRVPIIDIAELPLHSCCEASTSPSSRSRRNVGGRILKVLKLLRKGIDSPGAGKFSPEALQPALTTFRFQDQSSDEMSKQFGTTSVADVDLERCHYDSDEQSENVSTSGTNNRNRRHSCSTSALSSTRSSASAQSFNSLMSRTSSATITPRANSLLLSTSGHQSGAQLMANILISISGLEEDDDQLGSDFDHHRAVNGPRESAWHQPHDEILAAASPARTANRHISAKHSSGRNTPRIGRCSLDVHLTSPGPSRRFGKLDLSKIDKLR